MINTSKILTVSYGTFSCTLEGFDDSFNTMKAIAEYFQNLAADDRYFGAEPPTPDAEMLARIAEREIERRVEAYMDKGNIVLRNSGEEAKAPAPLAAPAPVPAAEPAPVAPLAEAPAEKAAVQAPAAEPASEPAAEEAAAPAREDAIAESPADVAAPRDEVPAEVQTEEAAAEEPAAIEAAQVETAEAETVEAEAAEVEADEIEDEAADVEIAKIEEAEIEAPATAEAAPVEIASPTEAEITEEAPAEAAEAQAEAEEAQVIDVAADAAPAPIEDAKDDDAQSEALTLASIAARMAKPAPDAKAEIAEAAEPAHTPVSHPDQNSVAAKLQRIRAVVSKTEAEAPDAAYIEDQHAEAAPAPAQDTGEEALIETAQEDKADDVSSILARLSRERQAEAEAEEAAAQESAAQEVEGVADVAAAVADAAEAEEFEAEEMLDDEIEEILNDELTEDLHIDAEDASEDAAPIEELAQEAADTALDDEDAYIEVEEIEEPAPSDTQGSVQTQPLRARVIRMKRSEFDAALAAGQIEEAFDEDAPSDAPAQLEEADTASSLSAIEEAELQRELAAVEAELDAAPAEAEVAQKAAKTAAEGALRLRDSQPDLNRMLEKTETHMDEPDGSRRRNAIAHLRAAVAATKAEQRAGTTLKEAPKDDAYRGDLADVVRPRRPQAGAARSERPAESRPAPLKLVAEQRVDVSAEPVRPRRISVAEIAAAQPAPSAEASAALEQAGSFADYAETVGATKLPDLLEAAASYLSFVEGMEQFSRPQLMTKVRQAEPEDFSREDGLRSFGQLLRAGKIRKIKGGRFEVSDEIGYRPGERAAG